VFWVVEELWMEDLLLLFVETMLPKGLEWPGKGKMKIKTACPVRAKAK
jgi:hypothetical protein